MSNPMEDAIAALSSTEAPNTPSAVEPSVADDSPGVADTPAAGAAGGGPVVATGDAPSAALPVEPPPSMTKLYSEMSRADKEIRALKQALKQQQAPVAEDYSAMSVEEKLARLGVTMEQAIDAYASKLSAQQAQPAPSAEDRVAQAERRLEERIARIEQDRQNQTVEQQNSAIVSHLAAQAESAKDRFPILSQTARSADVANLLVQTAREWAELTHQIPDATEVLEAVELKLGEIATRWASLSGSKKQPALVSVAPSPTPPTPVAAAPVVGTPVARELTQKERLAAAVAAISDSKGA